MQLLKEVLYKAGTEEVIGNTNVAVYGISINSREVKPGEMYVALRGTNVDGHAFILDAIEKGATSVLCEVMPDLIQAGINYIKVKIPIWRFPKYVQTFIITLLLHSN